MHGSERRLRLCPKCKHIEKLPDDAECRQECVIGPTIPKARRVGVRTSVAAEIPADLRQVQRVLDATILVVNDKNTSGALTLAFVVAIGDDNRKRFISHSGHPEYSETRLIFMLFSCKQQARHAGNGNHMALTKGEHNGRIACASEERQFRELPN